MINIEEKTSKNLIDNRDKLKKCWIKKLEQIVKSVETIIFPQMCLICGKFSSKCICNKCYIKIKKLQKFKIEKSSNKYFEKHLWIFEYKEIIRQKIIDYKFNDKAYLNEIFVKIIIKNEKICSFLKSYDIIIPVPIHKKRKSERGYNQSEIIARKLAKQLNIKLCTDCIQKEKNTIQQSKLNKEQRYQNAKGVYKLVNENEVKNKRIILFDDIYTTGSTANECTKILKHAGCKEVLIFTLAKD